MTTSLTASIGSIYAHRGCWSSEVEMNSIDAFHLAHANGYSIETDIRQKDGKVVISHDSPISSESLVLEKLMGLQTSFAINIKEDGLHRFLVDKIEWIEASNSFVFDGSIPEMYRFRKLGIPHALRLSEFERTIAWKTHAIWLDSFNEDWWINEESILNLFEESKVVVVSPELHGRDPRFVWDFLANMRASGRFEFSICTDKPNELQSWL